MDAASNNGVDYIRDIRDAVAYTPAALKKRVYIIDEVHMLSTSAFNALLKTLEEPPEHVVFILATTELHKLPATIISRCQRFDFRRIRIDCICGRLKYIAAQEGIRLDDDAARSIAKQAQGGMRDAISLFELCAAGGAEVTLARVQEALGLSDSEQMQKTAAALAAGDMKTLFAILSDVVSASRDVSVFWQELTSFYRDMMVAKYSDDPAGYLDLTEQETGVLADIAAKFPIRTLVYHSSVLDAAMLEMQRLPQMKRTIAEFACLRMCQPELDTTPEALSARIGVLEDRLAILESGAPPRPAPVKAAAETAPAPPDVQPEPLPAAPPAGGGDDDWRSPPDISEFLEKLAVGDKRTASFFNSGARLLVNGDGSRVRILCESSFAATMLSAEDARASIARTLTICRITSGQPEITVETAGAPPAANEAAEELYKNSLS